MLYGDSTLSNNKRTFLELLFILFWNRLLYYLSQSTYFWPKASLIVLDPDLALPKEDVVEAKAEVGHQG